MVQVSQAPQNQRLVFLQPVTNQNGQITYIQKSVPNQQSVVLFFDYKKKFPVIIDSNFTREYPTQSTSSTDKN